MSDLFSTNRSEGEENWISVSDLMAGLMMVFLFIMLIYARTADQRLQNTQEIVVEWRNVELAIYNALNEEFSEDLVQWNAEIEKETLTIRFLSPDILFETGKADLSPRFQEILSDFMPRYIDLMVSKFPDKIQEVRIEGHTSSEWEQSATPEQAFINNMELSQARTRTVLNYSLNLPEVQYLTPWMVKTVSANGLSSARLVFDESGNENRTLSKRVEFSIRTNVREALFRIIERIAPEVRRGFR